jgi:hypothetical protein
MKLYTELGGDFSETGKNNRNPIVGIENLKLF